MPFPQGAMSASWTVWHRSRKVCERTQRPVITAMGRLHHDNLAAKCSVI